MSTILAFASILCVFCWWLSGQPEIWRELVSIKQEGGRTIEQARIRAGWTRLQLLAGALWFAGLAVAA